MSKSLFRTTTLLLCLLSLQSSSLTSTRIEARVTSDTTVSHPLVYLGAFYTISKYTGLAWGKYERRGGKKLEKYERIQLKYILLRTRKLGRIVYTYEEWKSELDNLLNRPLTRILRDREISTYASQNVQTIMETGFIESSQIQPYGMPAKPWRATLPRHTLYSQETAHEKAQTTGSRRTKRMHPYR